MAETEIPERFDAAERLTLDARLTGVRMTKMRLTRRGFIGAGLTLATAHQLQRIASACGFPSRADVCTLMAEQEVGPYYVASEMLRSDISEGKPGFPLELKIIVLDSRTCQPLTRAAVDVWHCDALGLYSGFTKQNPMGPGGPYGPGSPDGPPSGPPPGAPPDFDPRNQGNAGGPPPMRTTDKLTFLRGIQLTGPDGAVRFTTIFPGYYMGRTNHIHFKVRIGGHAEGKSYAAGHISHVGQVFFPEELSAQLMLKAPYSEHKIHRTTQGEDGVFGDQHGDASICQLTAVEGGDFAQGMRAHLIAAVDPTATPAPARRMGGPGGPFVR